MLKIAPKKIITSIIVITLGLAIGLANGHFLEVSAQINSTLIVTPASIALGTVFPGEEHDYGFNISLTDFFKNLKPFSTVIYKITEQDPVSALTLCSFIQQNIDPAEGEPDIPAAAKLLADSGDISDDWQGKLAVPAIAGQAAQDNLNGITPGTGLHQCDLQITVSGSLTNLPIPPVPRPPRPPSPWPLICQIFPQFSKCQ